MNEVFFRTLKDRQFALTMFCAVGVVLLIMYIALFPTIQAQSEQLSKVLGEYPNAFLKVFNIEDMNFSTVEKFLAAEQYSFTWPLLMIFLAVSFAGSLVRDVERGTIDFALSRPISRTHLFAGRALASLCAVSAFSIASIIVAVPIAAGFGIAVISSHHLVMLALGILFGCAIAGIASMFGALVSERGPAYAATGGLLLVMYVCNIIANLKEGLSALRYVSLFHYFDASAALTRGDISLSGVLVLLGVAVLSLAVGAYAFNRRDIVAVG